VTKPPTHQPVGILGLDESLSYTYQMMTTPQILSLRLSADEAQLMAQLHARLGISKSAVVKKALRLLADQFGSTKPADAYSAGAGLFGRYGDEQRQSSDIKQVVYQRGDRHHHH